MSRIKLIHHVNVQISDRERTREWYEKVLGAQFLDRGRLNKRQLQLRIGTGEMHFTETPHPTHVPSVHFAVEVDNWEEMLAHLDQLDIPYSRTGSGNIGANIGGTDPRQGRREDNGEHYTYLHDPDGNMIELVCHPLGLEDAEGNKVEVVHHPRGLRWTQIPGFVTST
ncbi:MAG: VOC family protein [Nitrospinae bacterium]|nr:VOC family protein [Nitrospinota bacterium]